MRGNGKIPDGSGEYESVRAFHLILQTAEIIFGCALGMVVLECEVLDLQILETDLHNLCLGTHRLNALQERVTQDIRIAGIVCTGDQRKNFHNVSLSPLTISPLTIRNSLSRLSECAVIAFLAFYGSFDLPKERAIVARFLKMPGALFSGTQRFDG